MLPLQRDFVLTDLIRALDLFAAERLPDSSFAALTPPPAWLSGFVNADATGSPTTLAQAFPYLDGFLREADAFWRDGAPRTLTSGLFVAGGESEEVLLRATALNLAAHCVLVLERLRGDADNRPLLQKARETRLAHDAAVQRLLSLQAPAAALTALARQLLATDLDTGQRQLAERIARESERVQQSAGGGNAGRP